MYTYYRLIEDVKKLKPECCTGSFGNSFLGNELFFLYIGQTPFLSCAFSTLSKNGKKEKRSPEIIVTGGIHAREAASSELVIRQAEYAVKNFGARQGGILFLPMVNPDGNLIAANLMKEFSLNVYNSALKIAAGEPLNLWKANARGVDLNTNFDARFGTGKENVHAPSNKNFIGMYPFSEKETAALAAFTRAASPKVTLSYHTKGRVIYWDFYQTGELRVKSEKLARLIQKETGYALIDGAEGSAGGYKDWCIEKLSIPGFTIELGSDELSHPVKSGEMEADFENNMALPLKILDKLNEENIEQSN